LTIGPSSAGGNLTVNGGFEQPTPLPFNQASGLDFKKGKPSGYPGGISS
jgi:hypothetical protein